MYSTTSLQDCWSVNCILKWYFRFHQFAWWHKHRKLFAFDTMWKLVVQTTSRIIIIEVFIIYSVWKCCFHKCIFIGFLYIFDPKRVSRICRFDFDFYSTCNLSYNRNTRGIFTIPKQSSIRTWIYILMRFLFQSLFSKLIPFDGILFIALQSWIKCNFPSFSYQFQWHPSSSGDAYWVRHDRWKKYARHQTWAALYVIIDFNFH